MCYEIKYSLKLHTPLYHTPLLRAQMNSDFGIQIFCNDNQPNLIF